MRDPYRILGVPYFASEAQIRRAYAVLRMAFHPDRYSGPTHKARARDQFKAIEAAYQVPSNPESRQEYDRGRIEGKTAALPPPIARRNPSAGTRVQPAGEAAEPGRPFGPPPAPPRTGRR
jgi:curved DNA-binding protein CbpA